MAITIDYTGFPAQCIINIPRTDMLLISSTPTEVRQVNIDELRQTLDNLMDEIPGVVYPTTHVHTAPLTISGVTLARVVEILSPYVIQFEDGVYNVNIVGGNSNIADVTVKNSVGVNTANSAGLQDPVALQQASFSGGEVAVNPNSGLSGTVFPLGTRGFPVNNWSDALVIANERGLGHFRILDDTTIDSQDFSAGYHFEADNNNTRVTLDASAMLENCEFSRMTIGGTLDSNAVLRECAILDLTYMNGVLFQCGLTGTITLAGTSTASILQCFSLIAGGGAGQTPYIDMGGTCQTPLAIRDFSGGLGLRNCSSLTSDVSIDMSSGRVVLDSDITGGTYFIRGVCDVVDNTTGSATVVDQSLTSEVKRSRDHARAANSQTQQP